ncbi:unnamed protein product [Closterium sp. NIES-54]
MAHRHLAQLKRPSFIPPHSTSSSFPLPSLPRRSLPFPIHSPSSLWHHGPSAPCSSAPLSFPLIPPLPPFPSLLFPVTPSLPASIPTPARGIMAHRHLAQAPFSHHWHRLWSSSSWWWYMREEEGGEAEAMREELRWREILRDSPDLRGRSSKHLAALRKYLGDVVVTSYRAHLGLFVASPQQMEFFERESLLSTLDRLWSMHIANMARLRNAHSMLDLHIANKLDLHIANMLDLHIANKLDLHSAQLRNARTQHIANMAWHG